MNTTALAQRVPSRNMIVVRSGDESLHPFWLRGAAERHWDLHVSYFGSRAAPEGAEAGVFTWSGDGGASK